MAIANVLIHMSCCYALLRFQRFADEQVDESMAEIVSLKQQVIDHLLFYTKYYSILGWSASNLLLFQLRESKQNCKQRGIEIEQVIFDEYHEFKLKYAVAKLSRITIHLILSCIV